MYTKMDAEMENEPNERVVVGATMEINPAQRLAGNPFAGYDWVSWKSTAG
jgi:hypothetical protein